MKKTQTEQETGTGCAIALVAGIVFGLAFGPIVGIVLGIAAGLIHADYCAKRLVAKLRPPPNDPPDTRRP